MTDLTLSSVVTKTLIAPLLCAGLMTANVQAEELDEVGFWIMSFALDPVHDANQNLQWEPDEIVNAIKSEIQIADSNRDGQVNLSEFFTRQREKGLEWAGADFEKIDLNQDGSLSADEIEKSYAKDTEVDECGPPSEDMLGRPSEFDLGLEVQDTITFFDDDNNMSISFDEYSRVDRREIVTEFQMKDLNRDGQLSEQELLDNVNEMLEGVKESSAEQDC